MGKNPAFQFYPGDWIRDPVSGCSLAAQGLWLRMMIIMHDCEEYGVMAIGGKPMPDDMVARRCGCSIEEYLSLLLELQSAGVPRQDGHGSIFSRRMVNDQKKRDGSTARVRRHRAKKEDVVLHCNANETKCNKKVTVSDCVGDTVSLRDGTTKTMKRECNANVTPSSSSSSSSSSSEREKKEAYKKENTQQSFAQFWSGYPRKVARANAEKAWRKIAPDDLTVQRIIRHVEAMSRTDSWMQDGGRFIPHAATYLNGRRWEDDIPIVKRKIGPEDPEWEIGSSMDHPNPNRRFC